MRPWFEQHPQWLQTELQALDVAGIHYRRDEEAFRAGRLRLHLEMPVDGSGILPLVVTFPDLYPYFRFEVQAPTLQLAHHQNPFLKNLCLMPRGSAHWNPDDTAASVLSSQIKKVLETGATEHVKDVIGEEVPQAEPLSTYYPCHPLSMVVVQPNLIPTANLHYGRFIVGTQVPKGEKPSSALRGAVLQVMDGGKTVVAAADEGTSRCFEGVQVTGMWTRVSEPILEDSQINFLDQILTRTSALRSAPANAVKEGFMKLWGVIFPEEVGHRRIGEGWIFIAHTEPNVNRLNRKLSSLRSVKER